MCFSWKENCLSWIRAVREGIPISIRQVSLGVVFLTPSAVLKAVMYIGFIEVKLLPNHDSHPYMIRSMRGTHIISFGEVDKCDI